MTRVSRPHAGLRAAALAAALAALTALAAPAVHAEGAFAQLYAARPPAGSSFVRLVNPGTDPIKVKLANGPEQEIGPKQRASSYAIVKGGQTFDVTINGKPAGAFEVGPDTFNTLLPTPGAARPFQVLDDTNGNQDALKAEIRFYNLAKDCPAGSLTVVSGPTLFADVVTATSKARAINPVTASLTATCGQAVSQTWALPALQPGDHYSLFLTGSATAPQLSGQTGRTDAYTR
ncbi:alginate O-acetyltransferase AlgF [Bordetella genomosp. 1]|uniref:Alginate biosynthesis protein AlgF n=1 Tax=Bordetella genomosp. 1 TaxID=1395607 RepID=A0ABX4F0W4_9BORD|nr:alginate O-acetyltransferase AlgF [Bordetella genomosp. 1]OZI65641.1 cell division protein FtsQ [Bordetella genomosp. 1]